MIFYYKKLKTNYLYKTKNMKKDIKKKYENIVNDIKSLMVENYVFPSIKEEDDEFSETEPIDSDVVDIDRDIDTTNVDSVSSDVNPNNKEKIKEIRALALDLIKTLDPSSDVEQYKSIKSIWDSCDKMLSNKPIENTKITK